MRRLFAAVLLVLAGCGGSGDVDPAAENPPTPDAVDTQPATTSPVTTNPVTTSPVGETPCPEVIAVELTESAPGLFQVRATVRSVDIEGVSFADAWRVADGAGNVLGTRVLAHPHPDEQPFTRTLSDVPIPAETGEVEVAARDSVRGFCGASLTVEVPHS